MSYEIQMMAMAVGVIIPLAVFVWLYFEEKGQRDTKHEIAKHIDDPKQLEQLVSVFNEKKEPIDYRRGGVIAIFVGLGIFMLGYLSLALSSRGWRLGRLNRRGHYDRWVSLPKNQRGNHPRRRRI